MGICIHINKYKHIDATHYYHVSTLDGGGYSFYIGLSPKNHTISFFYTTDFTQPFRIIDLNKEDETIAIPGIPRIIAWGILSKGIDAINNNNFPQSIGCYA